MKMPGTRTPHSNGAANHQRNRPARPEVKTSEENQRRPRHRSNRNEESTPTRTTVSTNSTAPLHEEVTMIIEPPSSNRGANQAIGNPIGNPPQNHANRQLIRNIRNVSNEQTLPGGFGEKLITLIGQETVNIGANAMRKMARTLVVVGKEIIKTMENDTSDSDSSGSSESDVSCDCSSCMGEFSTSDDSMSSCSDCSNANSASSMYDDTLGSDEFY